MLLQDLGLAAGAASQLAAERRKSVQSWEHKSTAVLECHWAINNLPPILKVEGCWKKTRKEYGQVEQCCQASVVSREKRNAAM
jgi:hypothetical protein